MTLSKAKELIGTFDSCVKYGGQDTERPWVLIQLRDCEKTNLNRARAIGTGRPKDFTAGLSYVLYGRWKDNGQYGHQFNFDTFQVLEPVGKEAIVTYLSCAPGIGPVAAGKLWDKHKEKAVDAAKSTENLRAAGVTEGRLASAAIWVANQSESQATKLALTKLFAGRHIPQSMIGICIETWGGAAPAKIEANPFILTRFSGIGFRKADGLWADLKKDMCDPVRAVEIAVFAVASETNGSTWYHEQQVMFMVNSLLGAEGLIADDCVKMAVEEKRIEEVGEGSVNWYALTKNAENERSLSRRAIEIHGSFNDKMGFTTGCPWPIAKIQNLSHHQAEQMAIALSGPLGIFTGAPGTGKTYAIAQLTKAILSHGNGGLAISAPTGKAAVRAAEALSQEGVTVVDPKTMHSQLRWNGSEFSHNGSNPLPHQFHIIDEASMVNTDMMDRYLDACRPGSVVLLVLDPYQLPPVGHGKPALDMLQFGIPTGVLTEPQRNAGRIVQCCLEIRKNKSFCSSKDLDLEQNENLFITETKNPVLNLQEIDRWLGACSEMGIDLTEDVQFIAPKNDSGPMSCMPMNKWLQKKLNGGDTGWKDWGIKVGDKVICTKNGRYTLDKESDINKPDPLEVPKRKMEPDSYVANGEQGVVRELRDKHAIVRIPYPLRDIRFTKSDPIQLAWCITCHKSQGSEWPVTFILFDDTAHRMGTSEWVTTAISRAKLFCVGIGQTKTVDAWVKKTGLMKRKTFLQEEMRGFRKFTQ